MDERLEEQSCPLRITSYTCDGENRPVCRALSTCWRHFWNVELVAKTLSDIILLSMMNWQWLGHGFASLDLQSHITLTPVGALLSSMCIFKYKTFRIPFTANTCRLPSINHDLILPHFTFTVHRHTYAYAHPPSVLASETNGTNKWINERMLE